MPGLSSGSALRDECMVDDRANFRYLNREGRWLDFSWSGLEFLTDGALQLATLPMFEGTPPAGVENLPAPAAPAGMAGGPDRNLFFRESAAHRNLPILSCHAQIPPAA